ncbi:MAG: 3-keto-disaccharide hydrolase [Planctomycetota bacterium]
MRRLWIIGWAAFALGSFGCHLLQAADQAAPAALEGKEVLLFNGKNLEGWDAFLVDPNVKMEDVWSVQDGVLVCKGEPMGYLHTKQDYKNFRLIVEWRWAPGGKPGNSGTLMRITGEPIGFLAKAVEAQMRSGNAGDIWAFHGFTLKGPEDRFKAVDNPKIGKMMGVTRIKSNEKEPGEWNQFDITLKGGDLTILLNGEKVNEATDCDVVAGKIALQSEGGEIHFRTVKLIPFE